jgi:hypothetical protein
MEQRPYSLCALGATLLIAITVHAHLMGKTAKTGEEGGTFKPAERTVQLAQKEGGSGNGTGTNPKDPPTPKKDTEKRASRANQDGGLRE